MQFQGIGAVITLILPRRGGGGSGPMRLWAGKQLAKVHKLSYRDRIWIQTFWLQSLGFHFSIAPWKCIWTPFTRSPLGVLPEAACKTGISPVWCCLQVFFSSGILSWAEDKDHPQRPVPGVRFRLCVSVPSPPLLDSVILTESLMLSELSFLIHNMGLLRPRSQNCSENYTPVVEVAPGT